MNPWLMIAIGFLGNGLLMTGLWLVQRRTGNSGIVDVGWPASVALLALFFCWGSEGLVARRILVSLMLLVWGIRLSLHVALRMRHEREDGRYTRLKQSWGDQANRRLFRFYQFQAIGGVLFALPALLAARNETPLGWLDGLAVLIWFISLAGESLADRQLHRFRTCPENRGRVCQTGLWRYSRHPNYFFEWLHWWAYVCLAVGAAWGWLTVIGPLAMLLIITKVTGIPPNEAQSLRSRGQAYRRYQQTTSPFFPWFPRSSSSFSGGSSS